MKSILTFIIAFVFSVGYSQIDCINFGDYTDTYINTVSSDHATYPPGSAFIVEGDIQLIKPNTSTFYQFINSADNEMCYIGELGIDVSTSSASCRELTFDLVAGFWITIDGDTIGVGYTDTTISSGMWTFDSDTTGGDHSITIQGDFDYVEISPSTTCISNICLSSCDTGGPSCLNFSNYSDAYLNDVTNDHTTYPAGSAFITEGDIQLIKPNTSSFYQFINAGNNQMCYIGWLGIDVSSANYACRELTFDLIAGFWIVVDGDSINPTYADTTVHFGNWTYDSDTTGGELSVGIIGQFDYIEISQSTTCISNICLTDCSSNSCLNFGDYTDNYMNAVSTDHVTYPAGSTFATSGDIQLIKPTTSNSFYQFVDSTNNSLSYVGEIGIDVSTANYSCRVLSFNEFNILYSIDGDTIWNPYTDTVIYRPNWTFTVSNTSTDPLITIEGAFDYVQIGMTSSTIKNICLSECAPSSNSCLDFGNYSNAYIQNVGSDHSTYPNGSTFMASGDIHLIKVDSTNFFPLSIDSTENSFCWIGNLGIDISSSSFACKKLTYSILAAYYTIIDGDTIYGAYYDTTIYNANWTYHSDTTGGDQVVTIEGDFDYVEFGNSTMCLKDICLAECAPSSGSCLDFSNYSYTYIQAVGTDHATYPNGSVFMTSGDIDLIKVDSTNFYPISIDSTNNEFCFIGNLGIDVSSSLFNCKKLTYSVLAAYYTAIDGDTIYGAYYDTIIFNPNWTYTSDTIAGEQYITIEGDFDYVELGNSTMCISNICLDDCTTGSVDEIDLDPKLIDYQVFPNPTSGLITILTSENVAQIFVHNMQGQQVMNLGSFEGQLDLTDLEDGFYLVSLLTADGQVLTKKVLKQY